jgi:hypothetical protein
MIDAKRSKAAADAKASAELDLSTAQIEAILPARGFLDARATRPPRT